MSRIFAVLAAISLGLIVTAMGMGLMIGDLYDQPGPETLGMRRVHLLTGVAAALAVVLVESIMVTYFIGTSRWCKEVTETYRLDAKFLFESTRLKRRTFPLCVVGMLTAVGMGALGAASDPGTGRPNTADMADIHLAFALVGVTVIAWTYYRSWLNVGANQGVIDDVMGEVRRTRQERGLD